MFGEGREPAPAPLAALREPEPDTPAAMPEAAAPMAAAQVYSPRGAPGAALAMPVLPEPQLAATKPGDTATLAGTGTGSKFTFPTLNLVPEQELLPARGVYITRTCFPGDSRSHRSVTNIGMRPTFNGNSLTVETHLLDFSGQIPAKLMEVRFWKRLRQEKKFSGAEELRRQIARDIESANRLFNRLRRLRSAQLV